jgi:hypothetical protein
MLMDMPHSPPMFRVPTALKVRSVAFGSYWSQKFLGRFEDLFDDPKENPLPSWRAINWIVEDYGLSRTEQLSWANVYRATVDSTWTVDPPPAVATNIHFCACERRFKWEQGATIDSVEYNWPKIPGQFDTSTHCAEAYKKFWEMHKTHTDPELGQTKPYQEDEQVKKESIRLRAIELKREQRDRDNMRNATKRINYDP